MMKKLMIAGLTVGALALGMGASTAPANAQVFFGLGIGGPGYGYYHHPGWRYGYRPYGYYGGYHMHRCGWVWKWRHGHKVKRRVCW